MTSRDPNLDQLIHLISQCLGRIDEQAYGLQDPESAPHFDLPERLDDETATLQELVESLLVVDLDSSEDAALNDVVGDVLAASLDELDIPIVIRRVLCDDSSTVAAPRALVTVSIQRAMVLALAPLGPGDELRLTTRVEKGSIIVEIESLGSHPERILPERAETLKEFVHGFGAQCDVRCDHQDHLLLMLEFPSTHVTDRSESQ